MASERAPNLVLIVVDDLRVDHLSTYGYERKTDPHLSQRAQSGTIFSNCHSPTGWTLPSCASIITGHYPEDHGLLDHNRRFLKPKLGHHLGENYRRIAFTNNGNTIPDTISETVLEELGLERRPAKWKFFGWDDGFDEFYWTPREEHLEPYKLATDRLKKLREEESDQPFFMFFHTNLVHDYHMGRDYFTGVERWLDRPLRPSLKEFRDGPWVWQDPPDSLMATELKEDIVAKYDCGIHRADQELEKLFQEINFDDTIVILVGDHGEGFAPDMGRVHHCGRLHEDLLHVPLILWFPDELKKTYDLPQEETKACSTIDVVPTALTLLGQVPDALPGRLLFDLSTHRLIRGSDHGYIYWNDDFVRESYDTCQIELHSKLTYPLKEITVRRNHTERQYAYNLAYDPEERENLIDRRGKPNVELEPITFVVAVNDWPELEENLLASSVARSSKHQWVLINNTDNRFYDSISRLYHDAWDEIENDLVFFMHQDLYLPHGWEERVAIALNELEEKDPNWGVIGGVGAIKALENEGQSKILKGHWCDPHGYHRMGPLPHEVESLDEQWLGLRRSSGLRFDANLPGFHCYGIDISLTAREAGLKSYAIDAFVWHKFRDSRGWLIGGKEDSKKIVGRWTDQWMADFNPSAEYVEGKWQKYLPFQTTSWNWK